MLYWLMDLRYREIVSEWLYRHYLHRLTQKEDMRRRRSSATARKTEIEYDDLHLRMSVFEPNVKQLKREERMVEVDCERCVGTISVGKVKRC